MKADQLRKNMGHVRTALRLLAFVVGVILLLGSLIILLIPLTGQVNEGRIPLLVTASGMLLLSLGLIAFPFSTRVSKGLLAVLLSMFAAGMLWMAFRASVPEVSFTHGRRPVQVAAIAFAVLWAWRLSDAIKQYRARAR